MVVLECGHILCESHADQVLIGEREPCPVCGGPVGATKKHVVDPPESTVAVRLLLELSPGPGPSRIPATRSLIGLQALLVGLRPEAVSLAASVGVEWWVHQTELAWSGACLLACLLARCVAKSKN